MTCWGNNLSVWEREREKEKICELHTNVSLSYSLTISNFDSLSFIFLCIKCPNIRLIFSISLSLSLPFWLTYSHCIAHCVALVKREHSPLFCHSLQIAMNYQDTDTYKWYKNIWKKKKKKKSKRREEIPWKWGWCLFDEKKKREKQEKKSKKANLILYKCNISILLYCSSDAATISRMSRY